MGWALVFCVVLGVVTMALILVALLIASLFGPSVEGEVIFVILGMASIVAGVWITLWLLEKFDDWESELERRRYRRKHGPSRWEILRPLLDYQPEGADWNDRADLLLARGPLTRGQPINSDQWALLDSVVRQLAIDDEQREAIRRLMNEARQG